MLDQTSNVPERAGEILGDLAALSQQLGGTDGLGPLSRVAVLPASARVDSLASLGQFLHDYRDSILLAHELPAVLQAYTCAARGQLRELIALDQQLVATSASQDFANASAHVGRTQLRRLRPLRTERVVQRYWQAVEAGEAHGWHTVVFGLVLALYSLPLRQGLTHFAHQTLGGFVSAAAVRLKLSRAQEEELLARQTAALSSAVNSLIQQGSPRVIAETAET